MVVGWNRVEVLLSIFLLHDSLRRISVHSVSEELALLQLRSILRGAQTLVKTLEVSFLCFDVFKLVLHPGSRLLSLEYTYLPRLCFFFFPFFYFHWVCVPFNCLGQFEVASNQVCYRFGLLVGIFLFGLQLELLLDSFVPVYRRLDYFFVVLGVALRTLVLGLAWLSMCKPELVADRQERWLLIDG